MELPPRNFSTVNFPTIKSPENREAIRGFRRSKTLTHITVKDYKNKNYMQDEKLTKFEKS